MMEALGRIQELQSKKDKSNLKLKSVYKLNLYSITKMRHGFYFKHKFLKRSFSFKKENINN